MSSTAAASSTSSTTILSILVIPISEKLTKSSYPMWHAQVLPAMRAVLLDDLLTGEEKQSDKEIMIIVDEKYIEQHNPAYTVWMV
jgi:hypothetical protein